MSFDWVKLWPLAVAATAIIGTYTLTEFRLAQVEQTVRQSSDQPLRLGLIENDVRRLRCDVGNVKRLIKNQVETDC